ncbi:MAG: GYD domain-containing protein [Acidimicrobiales bacterium]
MARYLGLIRVSPDEAHKMVTDGLASRRRFVEHLVEGAGGRLEGMWLTNVGDWDTVLLLDMADQSSAEGAAATLARRAGGFAVAERWIELIDVDDVAGAIDRLAGTAADGGRA